MGEVFAGRYELLDPIAVGGMGTVWRVLDRSDGQVRAAKILRQADAASLLRFMREQSMRIDHPHVVTPASWAGMDDRVLFTMPLVRGGSVADLIREHGALPAANVAVLLDQALRALEAVHASGVVHRDVKPANLLLEPTGTGTPHLRLTDFGIAAPLDQPRMTHSSMVVGSPGYLAPEQQRGADPDPRQDIYSLGRAGIEMLTGRRPPADGSADPDLARVVAPAGLVALLRRATEPVAEHRYPSAGAMRADLLALGVPTLDLSVHVPDRFGDTAAHLPVAAGTALLPAEGMPADAPGPTTPGGDTGSRRGGRAITRLLPGLVLVLLGIGLLVAAGWVLLQR